MTVGRTRIDFVARGLAEYTGRLKRYVPFDMSELPDVKASRSMSEQQQKDREGEMILQKINPADFVVLLDERGREYSSVEFAGYIEKLMASGRKRTVFVVGGPYGFSEAVSSRSPAP